MTVTAPAATPLLTLIVGFTETVRTDDFATSYDPADDGYWPGAFQTEATIPLTPADPRNFDAQHYAEAVFEALNAPYNGVSPDAQTIRDVFDSIGGAPRPLSVGDTVTVGEVTYSCERSGWKRTTTRGSVDGPARRAGLRQRYAEALRAEDYETARSLRNAIANIV